MLLKRPGTRTRLNHSYMSAVRRICISSLWSTSSPFSMMVSLIILSRKISSWSNTDTRVGCWVQG
jgi:hypothetical protein